jgi:hypothetical protein
MSGPKFELFKVECKGAEGSVTHFFVPALSPDAAILQARKSVQAAQAQDPGVTDPFEEVGLEVRVGTFESRDSSTIIFSDWSRLYD